MLVVPQPSRSAHRDEFREHCLPTSSSVSRIDAKKLIFSFLVRFIQIKSQSTGQKQRH